MWKRLMNLKNRGKKALELRIGTIECVSCKLICNLNMEKWLEMKKIKNLKQDRRN